MKWLKKARQDSISETQRVEYTDKDTQQTWEATAHAVMNYDSNYGADADGHRGVPMWFVDEVVVDTWRCDGELVAENKVPIEIQDIIYNLLDDMEDWEVAEGEISDYDDFEEEPE